MKVKVIAKLNKRLWPSTSNVPLPEPLIPGDIVEIDKIVEGEYIHPSNNKWYKAINGFYFWSGGANQEVDTIAPPVTVAESEEVQVAQTDLPALLKLNKPVSFGGKDVKILILDSGISKHNALMSKVDFTKSKSFVRGESGVIDDHGHGTMIAGIMAGNDEVIKGISTESTIVSYRVAPGGAVNSNALFLAMQNLIASELSNIDVINMSLDINPVMFASTQDFVNKSLAQGVITVVASGEDMQRNEIDKLANVIKVSTCGPTAFKRFHEGKDKRESLIFLQHNITSSSLNNSYSSIGNDSAYTAIVTGIIASIIAEKKLLKNQQRFAVVKQILKEISFSITNESTPNPFKPYSV